MCLIVGTVSACHQAHDEVAQIIADKPDPHPKPNNDGDGKINYQRHQQVGYPIITNSMHTNYKEYLFFFVRQVSSMLVTNFLVMQVSQTNVSTESFS